MFGIGTAEILLFMLIIGAIIAWRKVGPPPIRFSMRAMLIAFTIVAVLLGVLVSLQ
jgi:hypothetical protein